jgi:hypothetical protein
MRKKETTGTRCFAISLLSLFIVLGLCVSSFAGVKAGVVTHLSGPLLAKKADGTTRILSVDSVVELGDTLVSEKRTYARIKFTDNAEMVMRPGTQFKISSYNFDEASPAKDSAVFNLAKGGIRSITGMIGKRGDQGSYKMITPTAVAGIRGTIYEIRICEGGNCGSIPDGLYLYVMEGVMNISNEAGSQNIGVGQYAFVQSATSMPKILPENPGIDFTLPPAFGDAPKEGGAADTRYRGCIVR